MQKPSVLQAAQGKKQENKKKEARLELARKKNTPIRSRPADLLWPKQGQRKGADLGGRKNQGTAGRPTSPSTRRSPSARHSRRNVTIRGAQEAARSNPARPKSPRGREVDAARPKGPRGRSNRPARPRAREVKDPARRKPARTKPVGRRRGLGPRRAQQPPPRSSTTPKEASAALGESDGHRRTPKQANDVQGPRRT